MRCLDRQRRWVLVSRFVERRQARDGQGRLTGKQELVYSEPASVLASVSAAKGQAQDSMFGIDLDYDRTLVVDDPEFAVEESSRLWVDCLDADGKPPSGDEPFDYVVRRVSRTESYTACAIKRVEVSQ